MRNRLLGCILLTANLAVTAAAAAQTVEGGVRFDVATRTATYDLTLRGQPFDVGVLFIATDLAPFPGLPLPPFGTLFLDPGSLLQMFVPLGATGRADLHLPIPADFLHVNVQAAFFRPATMTVVLGSNWVGIGHQQAATEAIKAIGHGYDSAAGNLRVGVWSANGDTVTITVCRNGAPIARGGGRIVNGDWGVWDMAVQIRKGDVLKIDVNGVNELTKTY